MGDLDTPPPESPDNAWDFDAILGGLHELARMVEDQDPPGFARSLFGIGSAARRAGIDLRREEIRRAVLFGALGIGEADSSATMGFAVAIDRIGRELEGTID